MMPSISFSLARNESCSLAAISAASSGVFLSWTANKAAASPVPPNMLLADMPCFTKAVIMFLKSAVVPGSRSPSLTARASICWYSLATLPLLSIIATFKSVPALSAVA